jgi:hypothetical protein
MFGVLLGSFLVIAATAMCGSSEPVSTMRDFAPRSSRPSLVTHVTAADGQPQLVTVIDSETRVMAVYQVDRATGEIALKSVRNMTWDLQMLDYNSGEPLPQEIRDMRRGLQP